MGPETPPLKGSLIRKEGERKQELRGTLLEKKGPESRDLSSNEYLKGCVFIQRDDTDGTTFRIEGWTDTKWGEKVQLKAENGKTVTLDFNIFVEKLKEENGPWRIKE